jgi:hypothetical protein
VARDLPSQLRPLKWPPAHTTTVDLLAAEASCMYVRPGNTTTYSPTQQTKDK